MPSHSRPSRLRALLLPLALMLAPHAALAQPEYKSPADAIALSKTLAPFDVISVKQNKSAAQQWNLGLHDDGITASNAPLTSMIQFAYRVKPDQISGLTGPVASANFDVAAKILPAEAGTLPKLSDEQVQSMTILLLTDRFHLKAHLEPRIVPVYDLVVAKGGLKIKLTQEEIHDISLNISFQNTDKVLTGINCRMADLASQLSSQVGREVIDNTGLQGHSDITLKWSDDVAAEQGGTNVISIFTAIQDQLGLKLQPTKGPVDTLVIDHAEMPSEN